MAADFLSEIRKLLLAGKLVVGAKQALAGLRKGTIVRVFVASNCEKNIRKSLERYVGLSKIELVDTGIPNDELGILCKKQFAISVLGVSK